MDRTDTGRGKIIQLYICNRHWFKLGLKLDAMKPDKMSRTGEPGRVGRENKTKETTKTHCPTNNQPTPTKNKLKKALNSLPLSGMPSQPDRLRSGTLVQCPTLATQVRFPSAEAGEQLQLGFMETKHCPHHPLPLNAHHLLAVYFSRGII